MLQPKTERLLKKWHDRGVRLYLTAKQPVLGDSLSAYFSDANGSSAAQEQTILVSDQPSVLQNIQAGLKIGISDDTSQSRRELLGAGADALISDPHGLNAYVVTSA